MLLNPLRFIVITSLIRLIMRGEHKNIIWNKMDGLFVIFGAWMIISAYFHQDNYSVITNRAGHICDIFGVYFSLRSYISDISEAKYAISCLAIILFPIAILMIIEKVQVHNYFADIWGGLSRPMIRNGNVRARGPFAHPILAGTVGAVCVPFMIGILKEHRTRGYFGIISCLCIVATCGSSGPIMSLGGSLVALYYWKYRTTTRYIPAVSIIAYIMLDLYMADPAYFILAKIDIAGGSTGWHRAKLIQASIEHLSEWWIIGTEYTRHWMPTGVTWSQDHTDITNYYLRFGVYGGLPLIFIFVYIIMTAYTYIGKMIEDNRTILANHKYFIWSLGSSLFSHTATMISVSYFDQSFVFVYFTLAAISSMYSYATIKLSR